MEKKEQTVSIVWKVRSLEGGKSLGDALPIDGGKFKSVRKGLSEKGYGHSQVEGNERKYEHYSIRGLTLIINEAEKTIRVEGYSGAAISQVADDFNLPLYRSG
jgi:hypothetical protein